MSLMTAAIWGLCALYAIALIGDAVTAYLRKSA